MANQTPSKLGGIVRARKPQAHRILFYGPEGLGKTTLGSAAPDPIFLDIEDGTGELEIARYPFNEDGSPPKTLTQVNEALADIYRGDHAFKTLVIDTADRLEALIWKHMIDRDGAKSRNGKAITSIEDYGYGKGYAMALDEWRALAQKLDAIRLKRTMNIIILAHAHVKAFKNPEGEDYDRYTLRLHDKAGGYLKEWADVVGFCQFEEIATAMSASDRVRGVSTGRRLVRTQRTAAYDAKTRLNLPDPIPLDIDNPWGPFGEAMQESDAADPGKLAKAISVELTRINDPELTKRVNASVKKAGKDSATLHRFLTNLKTKPTQESDDEK